MSQPETNDPITPESDSQELIQAGDQVADPDVEVIRRPSPKLHAFLAAIRKLPQIRRAAEAAGISPAAHYKRLKVDPEYAEAFEAAFAVGLDAISDVAIERATLGWEEPVIWQGQPCFGLKFNAVSGQWERDFTKLLTRRMVDNDMVRFILKQRHPAYKEKLEVAGKDGGPIQNEITITFVRPGDATAKEKA